MNMRHISLLALILAVVSSTASHKPSQNNSQKKYRPTLANNGVVVNQGAFTHYGPVINNGLIVNHGNFTTGNIPRGQAHHQQAQYPNPYVQQQQAYPQYQQQYQPQYTQQLGSFYHNPKETNSRRTQNLSQAAAQARPLTPEQQSNISTMEEFNQVREYMPKKFQSSLRSSTDLLPAEKSLVAEMLVPRMKADADVQELRKVMHVFAGNKEQNIVLAPSPQKVNTDHPLFFFNKEKSLFRETPNTPFDVPKSPKKLFYTPNTDTASPEVSSVCNQLQLKEGQSNPIHAAAFGKWAS